MDWPKAKNILIIALIATNLFLLWSIFSSHQGDFQKEDLRRETEALLLENGIALSCEIPQGYKKVAVLSVLYDDQTGSFDYTPPQNPQAPPLTEETARQTADAFLTREGLMTQTTEFFGVRPSQQIPGQYLVSYKNIFDGIEIEGCFILCTVSPEGVVHMQRQWLTPLEYGKNKGSLIPATTALLSFLSEHPQNQPITITDISLVYKLDSPYQEISEVSADTAFPMWRITCGSGEIFYQQAFEK